MAAGNQNDVTFIRHRQNLMRKDARIYVRRLRDFSTERRIRIDSVNPYGGRVVERDQHMLRRNIGRHVDGPVRQ